MEEKLLSIYGKPQDQRSFEGLLALLDAGPFEWDCPDELKGFLTLRYKETQVLAKNGDKTHTVKDVFIKFNKELGSIEEEIIRTTATYLEAVLGFSHPHLLGSSLFDWTSHAACKGDWVHYETGDVYADLLSLILFYNAFMPFQSKRAPYKCIYTLREENIRYNSDHKHLRLSSIANLDMSKLNYEFIKRKGVSSLRVVEDEQFEEVIKSYLQPQSINTQALVRLQKDGRYLFTFKNEEIHVKIEEKEQNTNTYALSHVRLLSKIISEKATKIFWKWKKDLVGPYSDHTLSFKKSEILLL